MFYKESALYIRDTQWEHSIAIKLLFAWNRLWTLFVGTVLFGYILRCYISFHECYNTSEEDDGQLSSTSDYDIAH